MKKITFYFHKASRAIALSLCLAAAGNAGAQTLVTPYPVPVSSWDNIPSAGTGIYIPSLNTAMILCEHSTGGTPIFAYACWDGGSLIYADINMFGSSSSVGQFTCPGTPTGTPDIVLANYPGSATEFYAVIAYPTSTGVEVDYYTFSEASGTISGTASLATSAICSLGTQPAVVHLDGIADYTPPFTTTGFPFCEHLVVTWDDPSGTANVSAAYIDLTVATIPTTFTGTTIAAGISPDVAAIKRTVGPLHDEFGLFTYTNSAGTALYYREWNITTGVVSPTATTLDGGSAGTPITMPRIDAIDDYTNNATSLLHANYKVAAQVDSSGQYIVRTYDNLLAGGVPYYWDCSQVINFTSLMGYLTPPPYNIYAPAVSMGGPYISSMHPYDATHYMVTDFVHYGAGKDILMMTPIDYTISTYLANILASYNYYWVSDTPAINTSGTYANSVSSPVNDPTSYQTCIIAWGVPDGASGTNIEYKTSPYYYAFKEAQNGSVATPGIAAKEWQAYPNPAGNYVIVNNPGATGITAGYTIVDMAGKTILQGGLDSGSQQVAIGTLPTGNYILKLYRGDGDGKNYMITKE